MLGFVLNGDCFSIDHDRRWRSESESTDTDRQPVDLDPSCYSSPADFEDEGKALEIARQ